MDRKEIKKVLASAIISEPCGMDWDSMTGDDRIRFCNQCSFKVHNLSAMSDREAAEVLNRRKFERTCIYVYKRKDGSVKVDNCPRILRKTRNRIIAAASFTLVCLSFGLWHGASAAGGLVGAGVSYDPGMGQASEVGMVADSNLPTSIAQFATNAFLPTAIAFAVFKMTSKYLTLWLAASIVTVVMFGAGIAWTLGIHV
jgi:hypothetical protein